MTKITKAFKNGHYYSVDSASYGHAPTFNDVAWPHQPLLQLGNQLGYSATITSKDENDFITSLFLSIPNLTTRAAWLGGSSWTGSSDDPNNIYWADPNAPEYRVYFRHYGSDTGYTNWRQSPKEPNSDGTEPSLELIYTSSGVWNDRNPGNDNYYVVEWGQNIQGSQNNATFVLGFDMDTSTLINAKEDRSNGNVKIRLNHAVYGDYYDSHNNNTPLIAILISLGGTAIYGTDYTITAVGGQSYYTHNYSNNNGYLHILGTSSSSGIDNVDLAIIPIHNTTWSGLKDVKISLEPDVSTYNIYGLDTTTSHAVGSGTTKHVFIVDDEPTLSLGQGLKQSIYTNFVASGTDTLGSTADTTLFDINGINETDLGGTFSALGLNDNFGIRWEGYIRIPQTGNYLFNVSTDDGVKLLLNRNNPSGASLGTIANWNAGPNPPAISASLNAGDVVWLQMDYFENKGAAVAQLNWQPPGSTTYQVIPGSALFLSEAAARGSGQGLTQTVYNPFYGATSNTLPDSSTPPSLVLDDPDGINESDSVPAGTFTAIGLADNFGVRWEGYIRIFETGTYQFQTISDDGVRLSLRQNNATGTVLAPIATLLSAGHAGIPGLFPPIPPTYSYSQYSIDNWTLHGPTTNTTSSITLNGGDVVWVQMDYFEAGGGATANLNWIRTPIGGSPVTEMIPANALFATEAGARGSGLGLFEPTSGEATGPGFTIYANKSPASDLNLNVGFSTTNGTTTINSGNAQRDANNQSIGHLSSDDYAIYTDSATTSAKLGPNPQSLPTWSANSSDTFNLYYKILSDSWAEADEAITMTLSAGTGYGLASGTMTTILHDQPLTLSIEEVHNPNEGDAGWVTIRSRINGVLTNNPIQSGLHVKYQITGGGTAARDTDYVAPKATINTDPTTYSAEDLIYLPYGASEAKLYLSALADAIHEGNETITLQLLTRDESTGGPNPFTYQRYLVDGSKASATVTINDSTAWSPGVAITPPNRTGTATIRASVNSNNQQQASVDVHLLSQPMADVTVTLPKPSGTTLSGTTLHTDSNGTPYLTFTPSNWSTAQSVTITGLSDSVNTTLSATTSSTGDSFYSGKTASQTIVPFGSTTDLPLTLWEGGPEQVFTPTVTVTAVDGTEGSTKEFGFTLNLDAPRVDSDLEVFFTLAAGSGFQLSGNDADVTTSTTQRSYNPLLLTGGSAYADLGSLATVGSGGVFSAEAWVRPDGTSTANTAVLEFSDASGANEIMLGFVAGSLRPLLTLANSSGTSIGTISGGNALVAGQWNHLAFSIDGNHTANLYLNGSLVASTLLSAVPLSASRSRNWVGQSSQSSSGFLNGAVRDVRVWNSSRSAEQIQASMLSSNASGSILIGAWSFSNGSANNPPQGLRQTVYPQFVGTPSNTLPDSSTAGPVLTDTNGINETDNVPGGTFTAIGLADEFGIRWEGYIRIPQSGSYKFQTISDDGIRLTLKQNNANGASLAAISNSIPYSINNWTPHGATINTSSSVSLNAGDVVWMQLDYFENGGSAKTELQWIRTPSGGSAITEDIPASAFYLTQTGAAAGASPNAVTGGSAAALQGSARFEATPTYGIVIPVGGNSAVVQFSAIDDSSAEATESISLNLKGSGRYTTTPNYISTANLDDNDTAGLVFSLFNADKSTWTFATSVTTNEGDATSTPPSHTTMGVTLATKPSTDVTVTLNPISYASAELQVSSSKTLTFTPANWNQQQQLILQGVDDLDDDRDKTMSLRFTVASADPEYNGLQPTLQVTNVDNDAVNDSSKGANVNGAGPLVSISSPTSASLVEGSTSTSSFVVTLKDKSSQDTVVYFDLDRKVGNALDNDVLIQPDAGSSTLSGLTLLGLLKGGQLFTQVDNDGIKETKDTFNAKKLSGAFTSTWTGWLRIDQSGSYSFQTQMTGGSLSLYVIDQAQSIISGTTVNGTSGSLNLTGGTFVPIRLEFTTSGSTTVDPSISLFWTRPASNGESVQELLPASQLQRVQGRHVVIPAGATSGGFNVSVVNDNVAEGVAGVSTQENLALVMLDPQPIEVRVTDWRGTAQAAKLTLDISSSSNREESYTLAAGTVLKLMGDPTVASIIRAKYTLSQQVTLHRDLTTLTSGLLTDPAVPATQARWLTC